MLSRSVSPSNHRHPCPGGVAAGKEFCSRTIPGPGPSQNSALSGTPAPKVHATCNLKREGTAVTRPTEASCLHVQHSCGSPSRQRSCGSKNCHTTFAVRSPKVSLRLVYLWALFLHTLWPFHLRTVLASAAVRTRLQDHNVFRAPRVLGRPGPGPGGRLPSHTVGLFRCSREPKVSLPRRSRARRSTLPDRLRGQRSTSFRALGHLETQRLVPASKQAITSTTSPAPATSLSDSKQPRPSC